MYDDAGTLVSGSFVDYLLPTAADTISFDIEHTTTPGHHQHPRHQGCRRGRHDRLDAGGRQRRDRRGPAVRRRRHPDAVHARAKVWKAIQNGTAGATSATQGAAMPHFGDANEALGNQEVPGTPSTEGTGA